ncbi:MAG: TRAP transporter permease [Spirochaetales bacterium]|nr:TRAP transporter permease [Spirochaetales bacterium]
MTNASVDLPREEQIQRDLNRIFSRIVSTMAILLGLFHLYTSYAGPLVDFRQRSVHLYALLSMAFLVYPGRKERTQPNMADVGLSAFALFLGVYMVVAFGRVAATGGVIHNGDFILGVTALFLVIEATRRALGWSLPVLAIAFLAYGVWAKLKIYPVLTLPVVNAALRSVIVHLVYVTEGLLSTAIGVSASYIILFILFGSFLLKTGAGVLFQDFSMAVSGSSDGGPAKVATVASGLLGSINGAAVANVVTTGTFTIPLMKKVGYEKNFAGAVEASASVGGQILPPIMGAAAFIMAENLGIPYLQIVLAGIIPAFLYYFGVLFQVHLRAKRKGLAGLPKEELPKLRDVLRRRGYLLFPIFVLVWLLFGGRTPIFAAFWSIMSIVIITSSPRFMPAVATIACALVFSPSVTTLLRGDGFPLPHALSTLMVVIGGSIALNLIFRRIFTEETGIRTVAEAIDGGVRSTVSVALACACVGIVVGVSTQTGIALNIADFVITMGGRFAMPLPQLLMTLILTMVASIVLGMGLPSIPTYIITSTMAAPILLGTPLFLELMGSAETAVFVAHMFVFYFGIFANITPPVALAAFAGAGISGGNPAETGFIALRLSLAGFIVPFLFAFAPELLLVGAGLSTIWTVISAFLGVFMLSVAVEGHWRRPIPVPLRAVVGIAAVLLIYPSFYTDLIGLAAFALLVWVARRRAVPHPASAGPYSS